MRLMEFFKEILDICHALGLTPVLEGSLAVLAYTANQNMSVNDVDLSCSEAEYPKLMGALDDRGIKYKLQDWHVLQVLMGDLKIEFGAQEHWYKELPMTYETLQMDDYLVRMLSLKSLREFYRQGMEDRAKKTEENERRKYEALTVKYAMLEQVKD